MKKFKKIVNKSTTKDSHEDLLKHPDFYNYGVDLIGGIHIIEGNERASIFDGYIYIECNCAKTIKYPYLQFVQECLNYESESNNSDDESDN